MESPPNVPFSAALRYWFRLGFVNFGGPAGQIAMMHRDMVEQRAWIDGRSFLQVLNFCMLLPGPEAHQLAVFIGWKLNGYPGGVAAGVFFLLPSVLVMLALSWLTALHGDVPAVAGMFHGISAAVVAIVLEAVWRIGRKTLTHPALWCVAGAAFVSGQFLGVPFPAIVLCAGLAGMALARIWPGAFKRPPAQSGQAGQNGQNGQSPAASGNRTLVAARHALKVVAVFAAIWCAVALPVFGLRGMEDMLSRIVLFFTQASFVTFGGAYAVLSYIVDFGVRAGWLTSEQMMHGLGLAETTPGPLIMVTQYLGFFAAYNNPGLHEPLANAVWGALLTTFAMFLPSFMFIFALAPSLEALTFNPRLASALAGVSAAVVGVVLKLAVFFGLHTFFPRAHDGVDAFVLDYFAIAVAGLSLLALTRFKVSMHVLVLASALLGMIWRLYI